MTDSNWLLLQVKPRQELRALENLERQKGECYCPQIQVERVRRGKRIKVEEQSSLVGKLITIKEMEGLKGTADLLNYMNAANWEFIDRKAITELNNPIWMSYIFRKLK